jgi:hypothetical protein
LAGADLDRFNSHYLASPRRRENVYFAQAFHAFAETNEPTPAAEVSADDTTSAATKRKRSGWLSVLLGGGAPRPRWQWGAALAALTLLVVGGWLAFERPRPRPQVARTQARQDASAQREQVPQNQPEGERSANTQTSDEPAQAQRREQSAREPQQRDSQVSQRAANGQQQSKPPGRISIASFVLTPQVRGGGEMTTVNVPPKTVYVAVRLELEPNEFQTYRVVLLDSDGQRALWRSGKLKASAAGDGKTLGVRFRAGLLKPQTYVIRVEGVEADATAEIVDAYPFRVVR